MSYNALQKKLFAFHHASPSEYVLRLRITSQLLENSKFETFGQDFQNALIDQIKSQAPDSQVNLDVDMCTMSIHDSGLWNDL